MIKKNSLVSIDILRAIAALSVFFYHQHIGVMLSRYTGLAMFSYTDILGAVYAVPLFFLLSGYCIHLSNIKQLQNNKPLPLKEYFKRRFLRIYPPFLAALLFTMAINYFIYGYWPSLPDIAVHVFCLQGFSINYFNTINVVLWTISIEVAFYILYPIFYTIRLKYSLNAALLISLVVSSISIVYFMYFIKGGVTLPMRYCVFNLWFAWCCGAYLADKIFFNINLKNPFFTGFYLFILIASVAIQSIPNKLFIINDQLNILIWTAPLLFLLSKENWLAKNYNAITQIIVSVGLSSYSLYLLHEPLISLKNLLTHRYLPAKLQLPAEIIGIVIIPVIAWFSYLYIEKPFMSKKRKVAIVK